MSGKMEAVLIKHPENAYISQENLNKSWETFLFEECPDYEKALEEYAVFEKIIKDNVKDVFYLPRDDETGLDSMYTHDPLKVTKKGAIYFPMGKLQRSPEGAASRKYLESLGLPTLGVIEPPCKIEGGDVVWIDDETVAIGRGYRTNDAGIERFKELTKDFIKEYFIVHMPHADGEGACLHLMSVISIVSDKLAVVYSRYMPISFRQFLINRGFDLIETPDWEYSRLGTNVLALAPNKVVVTDGAPEVKAMLVKAGVEVFEYPGHNISFLGTGGPTCLTHPIKRV